MFALFRLIHAGFIFTRYGITAKLLENFDSSPWLKQFVKLFTSKKTIEPQQLAAEIDRLGPSYVKLAQFLATRPDIVGATLSNYLSLLQDRAQPFSRAEALLQIQNSLKLSATELAEALPDFSQPIAAASIAQVHQAKSAGQLLAIKVLRPGIKARFAKDLRSFYLSARWQERLLKKARRLRPVDVVQSLEQTIKMEMDLRLEAAAIAEMAENTKNDLNFRVPKVNWQLTGRDVLAMEWIDGVKLNDHEGLKQLGLDAKLLAKNLMQSFLKHAMWYGFFHADMHPGNLFVDKNGDIIAIDFGITGRLGDKERYFLAQILYGFIKRDYMRVAQAHFDAGYVPKHHNVADFAQANRAIGEPIYGQDAKNISMARLLGLLFEITEIFDMQTRPELLLLQKNLVVVEGLARELDPDFNMWETAKPIVKNWMAKNMGPQALPKQLHKAGLSFERFTHYGTGLIEQWQATQELNASAAKAGRQLYKKLARIAGWAVLAFCLLCITLIYLLLRKLG
ncbi:2-polyprenylphenol 6-hydroxylase [Bartonella sp. TP]|uniref:2-polyprenylphenol 6-hydroxylase n=1 Tax=Bartonella sp. TP TaxID=3057550 RepID=UPI0025AF3EBF|nr:2-polyprenylphenol 6-hydroxylase [Bartonella sp. TP]MDN5248999.1 2-polyprenylphenol 6-hydroxylase [Alphaproteobacteria bacterium]WJW80443.1 2-polyprenylphenol 6-hydroxylase [Bartonella sp. TP]